MKKLFCLPLRSIATPPHSLDFPFPNKWSFSIIARDYWDSLDSSGKYKLAGKFANDAFQFGQAACSSPRALIWLKGSDAPFDSKEFWDLVASQIGGIYQFSDVDYVNKLVASDLISVESGGLKHIQGSDNRITRIMFSIEHLSDIVKSEVQCDSGFFFETHITDIGHLFDGVSRKVQTVTYAGICINKLMEQLYAQTASGVDRIVPIGKALDFSATWDGFNLFRCFTREVGFS